MPANIGVFGDENHVEIIEEYDEALHGKPKKRIALQAKNAIDTNSENELIQRRDSNIGETKDVDNCNDFEDISEDSTELTESEKENMRLANDISLQLMQNNEEPVQRQVRISRVANAVGGTADKSLRLSQELEKTDCELNANVLSAELLEEETKEKQKEVCDATERVQNEIHEATDEEKQEVKVDLHETVDKQQNIEKDREHQVIIENNEDEEETEVNIIEQTIQLLPADEQIPFIQLQIEVLKEKIGQTPMDNTIDSLITKAHYFNVINELEELMDSIDPEIELSDENSVECAEALVDLIESNASLRRKHISFSLQNETVEFRANECVSEMMAKAKRDVIHLDDKVNKMLNSSVPITPMPADSNQTILQRVEAHYQQHINTKANLLDELILDMDATKQLQTNTSNIDAPPVSDEVTETFATTAECNNVLKESNQQPAYISLQAEFSKPTPRSILRNKAAVHQEKHHPLEEEPAPESKNKKTVVPSLSAFHAVMGDVVENPILQPDALPEGKFIDSNAPKKRVSRFRLSRAEIKTT